MKRSILLSLAAVAIVVGACSSAAPSAAPTAAPSAAPTAAPSAAPTAAPSAAPTAPPSAAPTAPPSATPTAPASAAPSVAAAGDIVQVATAAGSFKTLLQAATAAGLVDTLKGAGPFTVFAPTDAAFTALPAGTLDALLKDPAKLKDILLYHVVAGKVMAGQVVNLTSAATVEGKSIKITVKDGTVYLNDTVKVVTTDIAASNGVIHVIDAVLLPPSM